MTICALCLLLIFFETAFGICLGGMIWNAVMKTPAKLCPGGACEVRKRTLIQKVSAVQGFALVAFAGAVVAVPPIIRHVAELRGPTASPSGETEAICCKVPDFAKAIGREETWKKHNGCS